MDELHDKNIYDMEERLRKINHTHLSEHEKQALWHTIKNRLHEPIPHSAGFHAFPFSRIFGRLRLAALGLAIVMIVSSAGATLVYADSARPTDFLFSFDLAAEKLRLAFASKSEQNDLRIKFAAERVSEVESLLNETIFPLVHASIASSTTSSTSGTATSTASTSTAPTSTSSQGNFKLTIRSSKSVANSEKALEIALSYIEDTQKRFEAEGNASATQALSVILGQLRSVAAAHIAALDEVDVKVSIAEKDGEIRAEIKTSSDNLKSKFKIHENGESLKIDANINDKSNDDDDKKDDKNDERERDDDDRHNDDKNDRDNDDRDDDRGNGNEKIVVCHNTKETITIAKSALKAHLAHGDREGTCKSDAQAPVFKEISHKANGTSAIISWRTDENTRGTVWFGTSTPVNATGTTAHKDDTRLDNDHKISLIGLSASTTYYYVIQATDRSGNTVISSERSFTTKPGPDTQAPTISNLSVFAATSTAKLSWNTNEPTTGKAYISTSSPATAANAFAHLDRMTLASSHEVTFTALSPGTQYRVFVTAQDAAGNNATSTELSFTTTALPDTAAPHISALATTNITSSTATVSFTTNESAISKLWLSTSTPVVTVGAPHMQISSATMSHSFSLIGLNATSTYYYIVNATDAAGNTATSSQATFITSE